MRNALRGHSLGHWARPPSLHYPLVRLRCGSGQCPELEGLVGGAKALRPSPENGAFELLESPLFPENCPRIVCLLVFLCLFFFFLWGHPGPWRVMVSGRPEPCP